MAVFRGDQDTQQSVGSIESILLSILDAINVNSENSDTSDLNKETTQQAIQACLDLIKSNTDEVAFSNKLLQVDTVGQTTYVGYSDPGTGIESADWAIKKIVQTGQDYEITWADGNKDYDNIWNDRLTLTYS